MTITTGISLWFVFFCLLGGLLVSGLLYYKNRRDGFPLASRLLLAFGRFVVVSLVAFLLLAPVVERLTRQLDEPLLIFVQDNSQSLVMGQDSIYYQQQYLNEMNNFLSRAGEGYDTRFYAFGEEFRSVDSPDFADRLTNISAVFEGIEARYSNRNIGAVILASDGLYNRGINPYYALGRTTYPVYTMALGDTTIHRDVLINRVNHNRITYLGNQFPAEIIVEARQSQGQSSRLTVSKGGQTLFSQVVRFTSDHHIETVLVELEASEPGVQHYQVSLAPVEAERNLQNNRQDFFIEVIDSRQKILILANSPHPDIGALKQSLEDNQNYEVDIALITEFGGNPEAYNLVVLHQLPSGQHRIRPLAESLQKAEIPTLFVIGRQTSLPAFNEMQQGLNMQSRTADLTEALPELNPSFAVFSLEPQVTSMLGNLPPLHVPFATYQVAAGANVLLSQRIGTVTTEQPLIMFAEAGSRKTAVIAGEGIWRWRLHSFARQGNHNGFNELISRMVQYLALREDKAQFRVQGEQFFYENDPVIFRAELYNPSYELVNEPEVQFTISDEENIAFPYTMSRTANAYRLDAGAFPPGTYTWQSSTTLAGERFTANGMFTVTPLNIEGLHTVADHSLLFQLASSSGGEMFYPGQWNELAQSISSREDIKPLMYTTREFEQLINLKLIFFIVLLLLSAEWFIRKRSGSY